jgi:hypothetical protein
MAGSRIKFKHEWDPRKLPKVVRHEYRIPRVRTVCDLTFTVAGIVWLLLIPRMPFLLLGPVAAFIQPASLWPLPYAALLLIGISTATLHVVNFVHPYWTRRRSVARVALHAASLLTFAAMVRAGQLFVPAAGATVWNGVEVTRFVEIVNAAFQIGFSIAAVMAAYEAGRELHRLNVRRQAGYPVDSAI